MDQVEEVKQKNDIVTVIGAHVGLKRAGRNFKGLCPFHQEKTPSFMVSPDKQIYHCFGCGVGGNVFNFLMRHERIEFPEAVEVLAKKVGIELPKIFSNKTTNTNFKEQLYKVNETACNFYHNLLLNSEEAQRAL